MLELLAFCLINLMGAMAPGPDFAIVLRYGLSGSRRAAFLAAAGIASALLIHVLYCVLGIAILIQSSSLVFSIFHIGGAVYLAYLGLRLIESSFQKKIDPGKVTIHKRAFRDGFLTNLLNPKATLFLLSLFGQFITPETTVLQKIAYGAAVPITAYAWFMFLSFMLTHRYFLPHFQRFQKYFMALMGGMLLLLSFWVLRAAFCILPPAA